jgi:hypothetical protein
MSPNRDKPGERGVVILFGPKDAGGVTPSLASLDVKG